MLDSFTALSGHVYSLMYAIITCFVAVYLNKVLLESGLSPLRGLCLGAFILGALLSVLLYQYRSWILGFSAAFVLFLVLGLATGSVWLGFPIAMFFGALLGFLGWFLLRQLDFVRFGRHSAETYTYTWKVILEHCCPLTDDPLSVGIYEEPRKWRKRLNDWKACLLKEVPHRTVRPEFERKKQRYENRIKEKKVNDGSDNGGMVGSE